MDPIERDPVIFAAGVALIALTTSIVVAMWAVACGACGACRAVACESCRACRAEARPPPIPRDGGPFSAPT